MCSCWEFKLLSINWKFRLKEKNAAEAFGFSVVEKETHLDIYGGGHRQFLQFIIQQIIFSSSKTNSKRYWRYSEVVSRELWQS